VKPPLRLIGAKTAAEMSARNVERHAVHERIPLLHYVIHARPLVALTAPLIYAMVVPFLLLDVGVTVYQRLCFPIYGIAKVRRSEYLIFDRARLPYLNVLERLNCAYCSYANGLIAYVREIAARTEQYWCAIKHSKQAPAPHDRYGAFAEFGDPHDYGANRERLRQALSAEEAQENER
jgi:hypothetical protein